MSVPMNSFAVPPPIMGPVIASPWERLAARMIDQAVLSGVLSILLVPLWLITVLPMMSADRPTLRPGETPEMPSGFFVLVIAMVVGTVVMSTAYEAILTGKWGATLGKRVMRLRVVRVADGTPASWKRMVGRTGATTGLALVPCVSWLNPLWIFFSEEKRAIHDFVAGTMVVKLPPPPPPGYMPYR